MSEKPQNGAREYFLKAALGGGVGVGALIAYAAIDLLKAQPQLLQNFGWPLATFGMFTVGIAVLSRYAHAGVKEMRSMAEANRDLAGAVREFAEKDSSQAEAIKASLGSLHAKVDELMRGQGS